jgi:hypothetical protein
MRVRRGMLGEGAKEREGPGVEEEEEAIL